MSYLQSLGYVGIGASDLLAWRRFATSVVGLGAGGAGEDAADRYWMDEFSYRLAVHEDLRDDILYAGWEVADESALVCLGRRLDDMGVAWEWGAADDRRQRRVTGFIRFKDPNGMISEAFYGPRTERERLFHGPALRSKFVTGDMGFGHLALAVTDMKANLDFYVEGLGFGFSDTLVREIGGQELEVHFIGCSPRHHSLALAPLDLGKTLAHLMLEVEDIDGVGLALDAAMQAQVSIPATLGRHVNDNVVSFYMDTPSGFQIEFGCEGRRVDRSSWRRERHYEGTVWGHRGPLMGR
ncbi:VOC family protein [Sphingobium sp. TomTYG45]